MLRDPALNQPTTRFLSVDVDTVADQIFDAMVEFPGADDAAPGDTHQSTGHAENVVPLFPGETARGANPFLARAEKMVSALMDVLEERTEALQDATKERPRVTSDVSYQAAQKRSQLPEGVEHLQGKPVQTSDEETLASIAAIMRADDQSQPGEITATAAVTQQKEPVAKAPDVPEAAPAEIAKPTNLYEETLPHPQKTGQHTKRLWMRSVSILIVFFSALMVMIQPTVSTVLAVTGFYMLFLACCMFVEHKR